MEVIGAVPNRAKAKRRKAYVPGSAGRPRQSPISVGRDVRIGDGVGTKFCGLTQGGLSASAGRR